MTIESYKHSDKRMNIPAADQTERVQDVEKMSKLVRYPRDISKDPQLVWRGKDEQDASDLQVPSLPIYVHERIHPKAIIAGLRKQVGKSKDQIDLFSSDFGDLSVEQTVDFYQHHDKHNWSNRLILGDSLQIMTSLAERERLRNTVQMIYMDPPYGIGFKSNWQVRVADRDVKDGKLESHSRDPEQVRAFRDTWSDGVHTYLHYLRDRIAAAHDLLRDTGSIFVQISDANVHRVRAVLDEIFRPQNFMSLITFVSTSGFADAKGLSRAGDYLIWYAKDASVVKVNAIWEKADARQGYRWLRLADGTCRGMSKPEELGQCALPAGARVYKAGDLQSQGPASKQQPFEFRGKQYLPGAASHWKAAYPGGMNRLAAAQRLHVARNSIQYVRFADDFGYKARTNLWTDTGTGNFTDDKVYVVQTGTKVVERCILMTTDPGDLVVDPTCGSGTTAYVAELRGRRWITMDTSRVAIAVARTRLMASRYPYYFLKDSELGARRDAELSRAAFTPAPKYGSDLRHGFVYGRARHVTLDSIAHNPDIREGMTLAEIDAAIERHAPVEYLYDQCEVDEKRVRVTGPFSVEGLAPFRLHPGDEDLDGSLSTEEAENRNRFVQSIIDSLRMAPVQNGDKSQRLKLARLDPCYGTWIDAEGEYRDGQGQVKSVAVAIGPEHGTVGADFVGGAIKEGKKVASKFNVLLICGFAFDAQAFVKRPELGGVPAQSNPTAVHTELRGGLEVVFVRMNPDLGMGLLRDTGVGNLFMSFGEPDVELRTRKDGLYEVEVKGIDVFDPVRGELRSGGVDDIACWLVDTDYDGQSFFVRQAYFLGKERPFDKLKTALRSEIDVGAWEALYRPVSMPFERPTSGSIAVKVINDYGDEVLRVMSVG